MEEGIFHPLCQLKNQFQNMYNHNFLLLLSKATIDFPGFIEYGVSPILDHEWTAHHTDIDTLL